MVPDPPGRRRPRDGDRAWSRSSRPEAGCCWRASDSAGLPGATAMACTASTRARFPASESSCTPATTCTGPHWKGRAGAGARRPIVGARL